MKRLASFASVLFLTGCFDAGSVPTTFDRLLFSHAGGTLFGSPELLTMKEIHLDNGLLAGREVIVEGKVEEVSEHSTYLVLADNSARLLIVLTDLVDVGPLLKEEKPKTMRVLGTIESGKKGLPFLRARSLNVTKDLALGAVADTKA